MQQLAFISFSVLMLYAAYSDLRAYTLPNFISLLLIAGFVLIVAITLPPLSLIGWHVGVAVIAFAIGFGMFAMGQFGGGDVKVIAALGLWFGPNNFLAFLTLMALLGGLLAVILILFRRVKISERWLENPSIRGLHSPENGIPYGVAIAIAAFVEFPKTEIFRILEAF